MTTLSFRFDIDTHLCIKKGVPQLLDLSEKEDVPFTFFLNTGRAVDFTGSLKKIVGRYGGGGSSVNDTVSSIAPHLSAFQKLGFFEYIYAAIINPVNIKYKNQIIRIYNSKCELGIHGGKNHSKWMDEAAGWGYEDFLFEIGYALENIRGILPDYKQCGFISPGFVNNENLFHVLKVLNFKYCSDNHGDKIHENSFNFPNLLTNISGEPGGIAYFEYCRAKKMSDDEIVCDFFSRLKENCHNIVYDHPYFVGLQELSLLQKIIRGVKEQNIKIIAMRDSIK